MNAIIKITGKVNESVKEQGIYSGSIYEIKEGSIVNERKETLSTLRWWNIEHEIIREY